MIIDFNPKKMVPPRTGLVSFQAKTGSVFTPKRGINAWSQADVNAVKGCRNYWDDLVATGAINVISEDTESLDAINIGELNAKEAIEYIGSIAEGNLSILKSWQIQELSRTRGGRSTVIEAIEKKTKEIEGNTREVIIGTKSV